LNVTDCNDTTVTINKRLLHQIGLTCLYIASKLEEIYPPSDIKLIGFFNLTNYLSHNIYRVSKDELVETEYEILNSLNYDLMPPTIYTYL